MVSASRAWTSWPSSVRWIWRHRAAQAVALLDQVDGEALVGQGQGGRHAGDAAADHQGRVVHRRGGFLQGHEVRPPGPPPCGTRSIALSVAASGVARVDPGALVADVGHLQQVGIEPGIAERVAEDRLVRPRRAGGDHHPVQAMLGDLVLDAVLVVVGAGVDVASRPGPRRASGRVRVDDRAPRRPPRRCCCRNGRRTRRSAAARRRCRARADRSWCGRGCRGPGPAGPSPGRRPRWPASPCRECPWAPGTPRPRRRRAARCPAARTRRSAAKPQRFSTTPSRWACSCRLALGSRPSESTTMSNSSSICFISGLA